MATLKTTLPFIAWRDGRPRFVPGVRERALGFKGQDLRHEGIGGTGAWYTADEARGWAQAKHAEILSSRASGRRIKPPSPPRGRSVDDLLTAFLASADFKRSRDAGGYSPETRLDYKAKANALRWQPQTPGERGRREPRVLEEFAKAPAGAIGKPEAKAYYEYLSSARGPVMARGALMVLSAAYAWGSTSSDWRLGPNPCHELDLPTPMPRIRIASDAEFSALIAAAEEQALPEIGDACYLGLFTGQRQGDVLNLVPAETTDGRNRFRQSKTGALVSIPPTPMLAARLELAAARRRRAHNSIIDTTVVIHAATGRRFVGSTFRHKFGEVRATAVAACPSLADFHYQDLRDTAVTWYARAGCTVPEIAAITGHSMRSIYSILKHYLAIDEQLADNAVAKLVAWMEVKGMAV